MLEEKVRMAIALKRFSLISPILNGQIKRIGDYCAEVTSKPIDMPHYGLKNYSPNTISAWYSDYVRYGLDGLKPQSRSDRGKSRAVTGEMAEKVLAKLSEYPKAPVTVLYDMLVEDRVFLKSEVSLATVRRFISANAFNLNLETEPAKELFRFAKENVNELWQTDVMYGPYIKVGKKKQATYLLAYLDDASRLITHAQFYFSQDMHSLRDSYKEAVLRRGIPKILYTDNGKIYRCQAFEYLCANIGVTLLHHGVRQAYMKGKIERFFKTVRARFLSCLKEHDLQSLGSLNESFLQWLDIDYHKKPHTGLKGETPLAFFLNQSQNINLPTDLADFNTKFLMKVARTIKKDATLSLNGHLYETDMALCGTRVDVKYDPDLVNADTKTYPELFLFKEDTPAGIARLVNFNDNAKRKRAGHKSEQITEQIVPKPAKVKQAGMKSHTISYANLGGDN